ncbi:TetR family transcriptional regulator [Streptomyces sp. 846.5]|nr:TetR/AcrR family transcriptional regulator [Streptomyces sp. 846.5]TDU04204.1 TetR family transcriptional regulator [Streptomyces sp. 846.5]
MNEDRPLRADAVRNRAKVLEAARSAFTAEGPSVPLDEIARRAGVGAGTVHRHFPTKEALLEAVIVGRLEDLLADARAALAAEDPGESFFAFFTSMIADASTKMDMAEALSRVGVDLHASTRAVAGDLQTVLGTLMKRAQEAGALRADAGTEDLHLLVVGAVAAEQWSKGPGAAARIAQLMCDALRP